jgi:uncharacterized protein YjgD (DUF1641 family)
MDMTKDQAIVEQLDRLEDEIHILTDTARSMRELRDDLTPRVNETVQQLIQGLVEIESDFQLEDLTYLLKKVLRNTKNVTWSVDQLKNLIDFVRTVEPLLKSAVPQAIAYLDMLEQQGIFQILATVVGVLQRIAQTYTPRDIEQIGNGLVDLVGVAKKLTAPEAVHLLHRAAEIPAAVDLSQAREVGPFGMVFALGNSEVKQGMGVLLELTKGLSLLKNGFSAEEHAVSSAQELEERPSSA